MEIRKIICDRCGEQINGTSVHIAVYGGNGMATELRKALRQNDFCRECISEIIAFAMNRGICDECIREMEKNSVLLRAADEETVSNIGKYKSVTEAYYGKSREMDIPVEKGSGNQEDGPDPDEIDWNVALDRMQQHSGITSENRY